ncbi:MAG: hypothetical protein CMJ06_02895 [Pelagibacterales bacterium]|nr:hypothetical protein [Pelagibacterales bacterium]MAI29261.1 hypothetical protein [Rickettsiales bacterium]OUU62852.1 MAG: hypothetical protein CBC22_02875 [Alphaproteobacteria bacterium TMED62]
MDNIDIKSGERSPSIMCDWQKATMEIKGESFPENVTEFYGPVLASMDNFFKSNKNINFTCTFHLLYFNSSSAKVLMRIFDMFEEFTKSNMHKIKVFWKVDEEDDNMRELGEEFAEDIENIQFEIINK